jgi:hypothetical protein
MTRDGLRNSAHKKMLQTFSPVRTNYNQVRTPFRGGFEDGLSGVTFIHRGDDLEVRHAEFPSGPVRHLLGTAYLLIPLGNLNRRTRDRFHHMQHHRFRVLRPILSDYSLCGRL